MKEKDYDVNDYISIKTFLEFVPDDDVYNFFKGNVLFTYKMLPEKLLLEFIEKAKLWDAHCESLKTNEEQVINDGKTTQT